MVARFSHKQPANRHDAFSFFFSVDHILNFIPGQFTELTLKGSGSHWFTISSRPGLREFSITTRLTGSQFKDALNNLKVGDVINAAEPMGDFVLPITTTRPILMVAGGIGITPFLSILENGLIIGDDHKLHLLYAASSKSDFIDLSKYSKLLLSDRRIVGRLEAKQILREAGNLNLPYIYTSGPEPMVESLVKDLQSSGIHKDSLVSDYFPGYE
ncbi:MAG: ferredoxin--NADP reductase [Candidatus Saccharimonadales bacterium]